MGRSPAAAGRERLAPPPAPTLPSSSTGSYQMAFLQPSRVIATCDECRARFDPVRGGVCDSCRRLLCPTHYYGSFLRRLQGLLGFSPLCPACRAGRTASGDGEPGSAGTPPSGHGRPV